ncbi:membrane-bound lytic murein transglycosylase MltF [Neptunicella marina]|uniref:Membrane-bound lytic murein transglycosylase F n=2 Tax=Neptunicella marina TaxID=2125989 RepID=A0A8J6IX55_9ALTE|nr:membrane-bound lytic murein transglycosylase MltF [Neptunicella marina]MBC3767267.1 membrane-bound lytic murein transglycosylase MltF [Neptunicella marina]
MLLMLSIILLPACQPQSEPNTLQKILNQGVLKVGTRYGQTTYYIGAEGPQGFEYELAAGFADYLGVQLEIFPYYNLDELFPKIQSRNLDIVAAGLAITPERAEHFRFGPAYQQISQKLVFKQGQPWPKTIEELNGNIKVVAGSSHAEMLQFEQNEYPELQWQETNDADEAELLEQVLDGELDYTIADSNILSVIRRRHPELSIAFTLGEEQQVAWLLSPDVDDSLIAAMIDYFGQMQQSGELTALEDKYYGHVQQFNYVDTRLFIKAVEDVLPKYRDWFIEYSDDLDWRLLAAMSYQESHWNKRARSATGVRGLMMLTLATARDLGIKSRLDPKQSIQGGAKYVQQLISRIPERIKEPDRTWFALAAYNLGWGHVEDARILTEKQGGSPDLWVDVKQRLPLLRQKKYYKTTKYGYARGNEATAYVANIRRYYDTLKWLEDQRLAEELKQQQEAQMNASPATEQTPADTTELNGDAQQQAADSTS